MNYLLIFVAMFATDVCWAIYVKQVKDSQPLLSAAWAVGLFLTGSLSVIGYTTNPWLLIPASLGAFAGTYAGVWWGGRKPSK